MTFIRKVMSFVALAVCAVSAQGQLNPNMPHIGYLYPAGGQQGCVIQITAGGQFLRVATDVYVSGEGVDASIIQYFRPVGNLKKEERELIQKRLKEVRDKRLAELAGVNGQTGDAKNGPAKQTADKSDAPRKKDEKAEEVKMPEHPLLYDLDNKSLRELAHITNVFFMSRGKQQPNRQIAETVLIKITISPDAKPGPREIRILTATGLTNPMIFQVGSLPEVSELEPNNRQAYTGLPGLPELPKEKPPAVPVMFNGQIMPGDIDRFRFRAKAGQQLVIETQARSLIPYLADAVPGWFQAVITLYDASGNEVGYADDYSFNPDPVLFYKIVRDGEYELAIRDSIYRGREDFIYRITVDEKPFITQMFPLGGREGVKTVALIDGWNLPTDQLPLDTLPGGGGIRQMTSCEEKKLSNSILYAVDTLPECDESESNDNTKNAQRITLPIIINGRTAKPGDVDVFRFTASAGDKVVAEVYARRLNSPLDSLLRLSDESGKTIEWNDDYVIEDNHLYKDTVGLLTHHADSYLTARLPAGGTYYVHLTDSQNHGGKAFGYRLRICAPQPDFALRIVPSSLSVRAGTIIPVSVYALRKDGFNGEIEVVLKDISSGFRLDGGRIPAGRDNIHVTLAAPDKASDKPVALKLEGRVNVGDKTISHPAVAAEDMMQAFLYRHLVPSQELLVSVQQSRGRVPPIEPAGRSPVRIPAGGSILVRLKTPQRPILKEIQLALYEPPAGVTLQDVTVVPGGLTFVLKAEKDSLPAGFEDNLIIEAFIETAPVQKNGTRANQKQRNSLGVIPAIPIQIVQQ